MVLDEDLRKDVQAFFDAGANKTKAALARALPRKTYCDRLKIAEKRLGLFTSIVESSTTELPDSGTIKRYLFCQALPGASIHPGFDSLLTFADYMNAELIIGGRSRCDTVLKYIRNERILLTNDLYWCGEMYVNPTAINPLSGFDSYNGNCSNIIAHPQVALDSVASIQGDTKMNYTTGSISCPLYSETKAGHFARQNHSIAALLVEIDENGLWFARHVHIDDNHMIFDIGKSYPTVTRAGKTDINFCVESITFGDIHAVEITPWVKSLIWDFGGMLDVLNPDIQVMHDVFSMSYRSHHEKDFHGRYKKKNLNVRDELKITAEFLNSAHRNHIKMLIMQSNHDEHLDKWLNECNVNHDMVNSQIHSELQTIKLKHINERSILSRALKLMGLRDDIEFADTESVNISGTEYMHGHIGISGAKASTASLSRLGIPINKAHDHKAAIRQKVYSAGCCAERYGYQKGPSASSISHIVNYKNRNRAVITCKKGMFRHA